MSLSTSSAPSSRSLATTALHGSLLSGVDSQSSLAGRGASRVAGSQLHGHAQQQPTVPGWRSVGEKSALRGYLAVLGVTTEASISDIRGAYKKLALQWHPDRSDAPNARMKFQEISQAFMALCLEEGDAQEIDVGLYEHETQLRCDEANYGMAGVTSGLAGVFCGVGLGGGYSPFLGLSYKDNLHLDLYRNGGVKQKHPTAHALSCTCHAHSHLPHTQHTQQLPQPPQPQLTQAHAPNCQCHAHAHAHADNGKSTLMEPPPSLNTAASIALSELDIASAVAADISLLTGVLAPPVIAVGDGSVQVRIAPLVNPPAPVVYQIQLKIKKSYQLVYQGSALSYSIPVASTTGAPPATPFFLLPGTRYMIRVRACPAALSSRGRLGRSSSSAESDDELEIPTDATDEATGLGLFSQPTTVTTQGTKPDGNAPHPPVLSNLQLAQLRKKETKGKSKSKPSTTQAAKATGNTPPAAAATLQLDEADIPTVPNSNASTPSKASRTLEASRAAPSSPPLTAAATVAVTSSPAPSPAVSKKEAKLRSKQAEEDKRRLDAEAAAQRKLDEEVAYQKFIMERRAEAERTRMQEEQQELERYAQLKIEQDIKAAAARKAEEAQQKQGKRGKKGQKQPTPVTPTEVVKEAPATPQQGRGKKAAANAAAQVAALSPAKVAAAPIMHIKLTSEQQAAIKQQQQPSKAEPLLPTPVSAEKSGRKGREPKVAPQVAAIVAAASPAKAAAWGSPSKAQVSSPVTAAAPTNQVSMSPIILNRSAGGKAWSVAEAPSSTQTAGLMPLALSLGAPSTTTTTTVPLASDSLSEHLHRFDSSKPWQADMLAQAQQQQPVMREQLQLADLLMMQQQHQQSYQQQRLDSSRFQHINALPPAFSSHSHSHHQSFSSLPQQQQQVGGLSTSAWAEDDLLLSDLQHELERERVWNAHPSASHVPTPSSPTSAAAEAAWNSTANTTISSSHSLGSSSLLFAPLSSMLSDYPTTTSSSATSALSGHDGIFMPTAAPRSTTAGFFSATQQHSGASTPPQPQHSYTSSSSSGGAGSLLSYSSLNSFPTTGLSRDAPSFNPMGGASSLAPAPLEAAIGGHTRLPLPATHATTNGTASAPGPALSGIFSSFALPSFNSFSSFGTQSQSSLNTDWSTHSTATTASLNNTGSSVSSSLSRLHDDSDDMSFDLQPALATDEDVTLISGSLRSKW